MILKALTSSSYGFGISVKDDGTGNLCLANLKNGNIYPFDELTYMNAGTHNVFYRHCYGKSSQGAGIFAFQQSSVGEQNTVYADYEASRYYSSSSFWKNTARPATSKFNTNIYGTYTLVSPVMDSTLKDIGLMSQHDNYSTTDSIRTALASAIQIFNHHNDYYIAHLVVLRTRKSNGVTESVVENSCGLFSANLSDMQWGGNRTKPTYAGTAYPTQTLVGTMLNNPLPLAPTAASGYPASWSAYKYAYNGETYYFCLRFSYGMRHPSGSISDDMAMAISEPCLYCTVAQGPWLVESVTAAAFIPNNT